MKLSVLTMITKPDERQDLWREALQNYLSFADEVVCVNGGPKLEYPGVKMVDREWPDEWDWQQLPHQLNFGKSHCTGDWILKMDIDMLLSDRNQQLLKQFLKNFDEPSFDLLKLTKCNYVANRKYYSKGSQPILFRNKDYIGFGYIKDFPKGDMCIPMKITGWNDHYNVPEGVTMATVDAGCSYWNFSYTFKTKEVAKAHYWRMARAYTKCFDNSSVGRTEEDSWSKFLIMVKSKISKAEHVATWESLPKEMIEPIKKLKPEQKGYNAWGEIKI